MSRASKMALDDLLTVAEVADIDRKCPKTIRRWITSGALSAFKVGGSYLVSRRDHEAFLRKRWTGRFK